MTVPQISRDDFQFLVENPKFPFLVEFYASWCETCNLQEEVLEEIKGVFGGQLTMGKVDMDRNPLLAARNMILSVPTMLLFSNGELVGRLDGYTGIQSLCAFIDKHLESLSTTQVS
jgi:thioredoxin-like negative regulator of GroEL